MNMMTIRTVFLCLLVCLLACNEENTKQETTTKTDNVAATPASDEIIESGQSLFLQRCASCHAVNMDVTGPKLKGVAKRWKNKTTLYAFIRNSQEVINTQKDPYAVALFTRYNKIQMPPFASISDEEIGNVLAYIKNAEASK